MRNLPIIFFLFIHSVIYGQFPSILDSLIIEVRPEGARSVTLKSIGQNSTINFGYDGKVVHKKYAELIISKDSVGQPTVECWTSIQYISQDTVSEHLVKNVIYKRFGKIKSVMLGETYIDYPIPSKINSVILRNDTTLIYTNKDSLANYIFHKDLRYGLQQCQKSPLNPKDTITGTYNWKVYKDVNRWFVVDSLGSETYVIQFTNGIVEKIYRCRHYQMYCLGGGCMFPSRIKKKKVIEKISVVYSFDPLFKKIKMPSVRKFINSAFSNPEYW